MDAQQDRKEAHVSSKAEKARVIASFMSAADELAMGELLKAISGSKWRFKLFEHVQAGTAKLLVVKDRLDEALAGDGLADFLGSADENEFQIVPERGLQTREASRRAVIFRFCELWSTSLQSSWESMYAITLQKSARCWFARKRLRKRRYENIALVDGLGRFGLESVLKRLCGELDITNLADCALITNARLSELTWMNAQTKQRFRNFQKHYAMPVPGIFSRASSAQGFSRTTSLHSFNRAASAHIPSSEDAPQRALSVVESVGPSTCAASWSKPKTLFGGAAAVQKANLIAHSSTAPEQQAMFSRAQSGPISRVTSLPNTSISRTPSGPAKNAAGSILFQRALSADRADGSKDIILDKMFKIEETAKMQNSKIYNKHDFWEKDFKVCLACKGTDLIIKDLITKRKACGSCEGTTTFTCRPCGWKIMFRYDDEQEPRYFETKGWKRATRMKNVALGIMAAQRMGRMLGALGGGKGAVLEKLKEDTVAESAELRDFRN